MSGWLSVLLSVKMEHTGMTTILDMCLAVITTFFIDGFLSLCLALSQILDMGPLSVFIRPGLSGQTACVRTVALNLML